MSRKRNHTAYLHNDDLYEKGLVPWCGAFIDADYTMVMYRGVRIADIDYLSKTVTARDWYGAWTARLIDGIAKYRLPKFTALKTSFADWENTDVPQHHISTMSLSNSTYIGAQVIRQFIDRAWSKFVLSNSSKEVV